MSDALAMLSACELVRRYGDGSLSPVAATEAALDRIVLCNATLNAFSFVDGGAALQAARQSETRWRRAAPLGPVDGVPVSVKDNLLTKGWPTLKGSCAVEPNQPWDEDAPAVARLREQGAVLLGKTCMPEFGWKAVTDSPLNGITRNPWNPATTPGGSSGGAAVAVATGMGPLALGTDGGGSVRIPASFTGVFGLKPTFGRVPAWPPSPFGTVAQIGPMTRTVADAALLMNAIARPDPRDWYALPPDDTDYLGGLEAGVRGLRLAFSPDLGVAGVDPEVAGLIAAAATVFRELGAVVEETDPGLGDLHDTYLCVHAAGAASIVAGFAAARPRMDPGLIALAEFGERLSLTDYLGASRARETAGYRMNLFHQSYDLLLTPTLPIAAFAAGSEVPPGGGLESWIDWTPMTYPFNLTGQPAATVPCGLTAAGLPVGLQVVGPRYGDALVLRACRAYEAARPFVMPDLEARSEA
jgi:aspartyl-tRNA(Asn)/glutamyl-tRNA(Gln) amidotransferase subunit A